MAGEKMAGEAAAAARGEDEGQVTQQALVGKLQQLVEAMQGEGEAESYRSQIGEEFVKFYESHFPWQARDQMNIPVVDVAFKVGVAWRKLTLIVWELELTQSPPDAR